MTTLAHSRSRYQHHLAHRLPRINDVKRAAPAPPPMLLYSTPRSLMLMSPPPPPPSWGPGACKHILVIESKVLTLTESHPDKEKPHPSTATGQQTKRRRCGVARCPQIGGSRYQHHLAHRLPRINDIRLTAPAPHQMLQVLLLYSTPRSLMLMPNHNPPPPPPPFIGGSRYQHHLAHRLPRINDVKRAVGICQRHPRADVRLDLALKPPVD